MEKHGKEEKRKEITRADIMERMRDCWERLSFDRKLSKREESLIESNLYLIKLYKELNQGERDCEHTFACGFEYEEEESEYEEGEG